MDSDHISRFKYSITHRCITRRERVNECVMIPIRLIIDYSDTSVRNMKGCQDAVKSRGMLFDMRSSIQI